MTSIDLTDARALIAMVASGAVRPLEVAAAVRARADEVRELNVFVDPELPGLEERAQAATPGRLAGLPVVVKDCVDVAGLPTSGGTPALLGRLVSRDAPLIAALRREGAVVVGKNTMHELSFGITSNNACTGPARNPLDPTRIPGGSSGGTAAAVAAGIAPVGVGADTGGSSRLPAGLCGIVGYRPTHGRYSADGLLPIAHTRDTAGLIAHTVADIRLVDSVLTGSAEAAPAARPLDAVRLGVPVDYWRDLDPETERLCRQARDQLAAAGVELVDVDLTALTELSEDIALPLCLYEFPHDVADYLRREEDGITVEQVCARVASPDVQGIVEACVAGPVDETTHQRLLDRRGELQAGYSALLAAHSLDGLVFPTTPLPAAPIGDDESTALNGRQVPTFPTFIRHTNLAGVAGHPGISVPVGLTDQGLPVGLEIDGAGHADAALLALAEAVEAVLR